MIKKTLYPKTKRLWIWEDVTITEKLDWSNLWFFNLWWELYIAQRNNIYKASEIYKDIAYKWLIWRLEENKIELNEWSCIFWERIGMWYLKYNFDNRFFMFAKANINEDYEVYNINYIRKYFVFSFINQEIPDFISVVPTVASNIEINMANLDKLYDEYSKEVWRDVEWFVINYWNSVKKYIRHKEWKIQPHKV